MKCQAPEAAEQGRQRQTAQAVTDGHARAEAFVMNRRPDAVAQRRLQEMVDTSPRVAQSRAQVRVIDASPRVAEQRARASFACAPVQRVTAVTGTAPIQLQLMGQDLVEIEAFFLREIRAIGSPTTRAHRELLAAAKNDVSLLAAKQRITAFIQRWHAALDDELDGEESDEEPVLRDERYIPTNERGPISSVDMSTLVGARTEPRLPGDAGRNPRAAEHFPYTALKGTDRRTKLQATAHLAQGHGTTSIELEKRANTQMLHQKGVLDYIDRLAAIVGKDPSFAARIKADPSLSLGGLVGVYYRYHKFGDSDRSGLVFGGGFNKSDIDSDVPDTDRDGKPLHTKAINKHFSDRNKALKTLSSGTPLAKAKALEEAQANAFSTPFIATTETRGYASDLLKEYPPDKGQYAVMLTILGPSMNTLDFEHEFASLKAGPAENNFRTVPKRAKDKEQAEFGIPDIYIPIGQRSPLGFVIAHIERLS